MLGLLLTAISTIAEIFILISHLQRLLSMFEGMSIFFDRKMTVILAPYRRGMIVDIDDDSGKRSFIINRRIKTTIRKDILW